MSDSCEISCIIDWQHATILPLLLVAGNPPLFENPNPEPPQNYEKPTLPEDYDSLNPEDRSHVDELHRRRMLFYLYMIFNGKDNDIHFTSLQHPMLSLVQHLVDRAGRPWTGNVITLKGALLRIVNSWDALLMANGAKSNNSALPSCPVRFDPEDEKEFYQAEQNWFKCNIFVEHLRSELDGLGQDGWVRNEVFEKVVDTNNQLKKQWINEAEDDEDLRCVEHWPFQDHEEIE